MCPDMAITCIDHDLWISDLMQNECIVSIPHTHTHVGSFYSVRDPTLCMQGARQGHADCNMSIISPIEITCAVLYVHACLHVFVSQNLI